MGCCCSKWHNQIAPDKARRQQETAQNHKTDSKNEKGLVLPQQLPSKTLVGVRNLGSTGYLAAWLQLLYHIPAVRKALYEMPVEGGSPGAEIVRQLQILLAQMQLGEEAVSPAMLMSVLGFRTDTAQDVWECHNSIIDSLPEEGLRSLKELLMVGMESCIEGLDTPFRSALLQVAWGQDLEVVGHHKLMDCFEQLMQVDMLVGDDAFLIEGGKRIDACKSQRLKRLPPVLLLRLKRYQFDWSTMALAKVSTHLSFPEHLDLTEGTGRFIATDAVNDAQTLHYRLAGVISHAGTTSAGVYATYARPDAADWVKFVDSTVQPVTEQDVFQGLKGDGDDWHASAYVCAYIRGNLWDTIMAPLDTGAIPERVRLGATGQLPQETPQGKAAEQHPAPRIDILTLA